MKRKLFVVGVGVAIGYLLGSHAGRERYELMKSQVIRLWENPRVARTRQDVEAYARQQAPLIRERAESAARAAPGVARDVAGRVAETAKDVADKATTVASDVADKSVTAARDAAEKANDVAGDARRAADKLATDMRDRGEAAVDNAVVTAGKARDRVLDELDDEDDPRA